jgi:hypothetical protein
LQCPHKFTFVILEHTLIFLNLRRHFPQVWFRRY